jgi:hypothetical protein
MFIDIETTGTVVGSGIWQIAYCLLDDEQLHRFSVADVKPGIIDLLVRPDARAYVDPKTIEWIEAQPGVNRLYRESGESQLSIFDAISHINHDIASKYSENDYVVNTYSWGNFDIPLLEYWYDKNDIKKPWRYDRNIDLRSVLRFIDIDGDSHYKALRPRSSHDAADDVAQLMQTWKSLQKNIDTYKIPV